METGGPYNEDWSIPGYIIHDRTPVSGNARMISGKLNLC